MTRDEIRKQIRARIADWKERTAYWHASKNAVAKEFMKHCEARATEADAILQMFEGRPDLEGRVIQMSQHCADCDEAAKLAYSDATTPGFFSPKCEKHREASPSEPKTGLKPLNIVDDRNTDADDWLMPDYHPSDPRFGEHGRAPSKPGESHLCSNGNKMRPYRAELCSMCMNPDSGERTFMSAEEFWRCRYTSATRSNDDAQQYQLMWRFAEAYAQACLEHVRKGEKP